ncbi:uncharacterized protein LOC144420790 [Styela clava]
MPGPDLVSSLIGVLTQFRKGRIALVADIEAMFHQIKVKKEDCNALRFLWWPNGDISKKAELYSMERHIFGACSSPCIASFCLKETGKRFGHEFDKIICGIVENGFYVDDCLTSSDSDEGAIDTKTQLCKLMKKGGFNLTKWISNSSTVMARIPESEQTKSIKDLDLHEPRKERVLGVDADAFQFRSTVPKLKTYTRRTILSAVNSLFDPLGMLAPVILVAKMLQQEIIEKGLGWDEVITEDNVKEWDTWFNQLTELEYISISRCFKPQEFGNIKHCQIHHFSDASSFGYGRWLLAPEFLWKNEDSWPINCEDKTDLPDEFQPIERKKVATIIASNIDTMDNYIKSISDLQRLKISTAWVLRYKGFLRNHNSVTTRNITVEEMQYAEQALVKYVQHQNYKSVIDNLSDKSEIGDRKARHEMKKVEHTKSIAKLDPIIPDGILRIGGRLDKAPISFEMRHPIIFPNDHHLTRLIIDFYHKKVGHSSVSHTWNVIREKFWITRPRATIWHESNKCVIDFFGQYLIKRGRSEIKRYGCIFIELAEDLSTDAFINALRRFMARRSKPFELHSDNGSNFVGAQRILREEIQKLDHTKLDGFFRKQEIRWYFNTPTASNQGGSWEILIRSIRRILNKMFYKSPVVSQDVLHTALLEAEYIINSRPLCRVSFDPRDNAPLSPNHLLLQRPTPCISPGLFDNQDSYSRLHSAVASSSTSC